MRVGSFDFPLSVYLEKRDAQPNQSLKLTEPAVDDLAARKKFLRKRPMPAARIVYTELAARRRSLAPIR